jgi:hypothetical protein
VPIFIISGAPEYKGHSDVALFICAVQNALPNLQINPRQEGGVCQQLHGPLRPFGYIHILKMLTAGMVSLDQDGKFGCIEIDLTTAERSFNFRNPFQVDLWKLGKLNRCRLEGNRLHVSRLNSQRRD